MLKRLIKGFYKRYHRCKVYHKYRDILGRNLALKNKFKGRRCFIIGNGPSLNDQNLLKLANEETFVVNNFWKYPQFNLLKPKNYVVLDSGSIKQESIYFKDVLKKELIRMEENKSEYPARFFFNLPGFYYDLVRETGLLTNKEVYYIIPDGFFKDNLKFNLEIDKMIPWTKNVVLSCIIIAIYMGFEEIYLLGCEHSFLVPINPLDFEAKSHFYEVELKVPKNREEQLYTGLFIQPYEERIDQIKALFRNYRLLKKKINIINPGVKILNATPNSYLDVFPKINYDDIPF